MNSTQLACRIPGFPNYTISTDGIVYSNQAGRIPKIIKSRIDRAGYVTVRLSANGHVTTFFLHRLVAQVYIPNPTNLTHVNHINGDKLDNRPDNLEWVSHAVNILHAHRTGLIPVKRSRRAVIDKCCNRRFANVSEAARHYSIPLSTCRQYLFGQLPNPTCLQLEAA